MVLSCRAVSTLFCFKVQEESPGGLAGLEAYFDYIVSVSDVRLVR